MSKTLLAVDDSATMRKVLDITFSGEDFRVVGAENRDAALAKLSEQPNVVVLDLSLGADDSYALAKEIRQRAPSATIVLMASRYNPYDANKGREAGVDDSVDKPFDTQQMIEKVKKAMLAREAGGGVAAAAAPAPAVGRPSAPGTGPSGTVPSIQSPFQQQAGATRPTGVAPPPAPPPPPPPPQKPAAVPVSTSTSRTHTLSFENSPFAAPPAAAKPPAPPAQQTTTAIATPPPPPAPPAAPAAVARPAAAAPVAAAVNGALSGKLSELGLTPAQADAVLALSREVVERIVWEVVPQLAETIIKEEIARLTKEG